MTDYTRLKQAAAQSRTSKPYGANTLEETNVDQLKASLLQQMDGANIPRPNYLIIQPSQGWESLPNSPPEAKVIKAMEGDYIAYTQKDRIVIDLGPNAINILKQHVFPGQMPCNNYAINLAEDTASAVLHEASHYIAFHITQSGSIPKQVAIRPKDYSVFSDSENFDFDLNLNADVFGHINKVVLTQPPAQYVAALKKSLDSKSWIEKNADKIIPVFPFAKIAYGDPVNWEAARTLQDKYNISNTTARQTYERIGDAGEALYALSNYGDTEKIKTYLRNNENSRNGTPDHTHNTASSIEAAIEAFSKNPRKGLSIVETTQWAAKIIEAQPELNKSPREMAHEIEIHRLASYGLSMDSKAPYKAALKEGTGLSDQDKKEIKVEIDRLAKARNAVCLVTP